jgi:hypothetical protein
MGGCVSKKNILNNTETIIRLNQNKPTSQPIREVYKKNLNYFRKTSY